MRLLCTGDLHIGRRSAGTSGDGFSCGDAWDRIAALAAGEAVDGQQIPRVDAVLISGDVTDQSNRYFQAIGPFERGLAKLRAAKVPVLAVAGNHDHDTLRDVAPRLQTNYGFRLLGADGWEETTLERDGETIRIVGWSYPGPEHPGCPLHELRLAPSNLPTVGLVHVQRGGPDGRFAYGRDEDLRAHPEVDLWVVGHVHVPRNEFGTSLRVVNPGSPQAMDFGEGGWHGVSVVHVRGKGNVRCTEEIGTSSAWYQRVGIELHGDTLTDLTSVREHVREVLAQARDEFVARSSAVRFVEFRVELMGVSSVPHGALDGLCRELTKGIELRAGEGETPIRVAVSGATASGVRPLRDLDAYAAWTGPVAVLARTLRALARPEPLPPDLAAFVAQLGHLARQRSGHARFAAAKDVPPPDEATLRQWAVEEGYVLLERLLAQNPEAGRPAEVEA
ncbi:MAG: metallophosphoesterase family protein [Fimbriimonas sp.]